MIGKFRDYTVKIGTGEDEVILSASPVVINYTGDMDDPLKPIRSSECQINIVTDSFPTEIYTAKVKDTEVKVYKGDNLLWKGYMEPNVYSQPLDNGLVELEIVALDYLATMEEVEYNVDVQSVRSFYDLITSCTGLTVETTENLDYYCLDSNFTDEDGDNMTNYEVVENILLYLGLCCYQKADKVIIYDPVEASGNVYNSDIITKTPGTLSIGETYNKITINSSVYNDDDYFKDFSAAEYLNSYSAYPLVTNEAVTKVFGGQYQILKSQLAKFKSYNDSGEQIDYTVGLKARTAFPIKLKNWNYKDKETKTQKPWQYWICFPYNTKYLAAEGERVIYEVSNFSPPYQTGYLCVNFDTLADIDIETPIALEGYYKSSSDEDQNRKIDPTNSDVKYNPYVYCSIKFGDFSWDGSTWVRREEYFKVYIGEKGDTVQRRVHKTRSNLYLNGTQQQGWCIPLPDTRAVCGSLSFKLRCPRFGDEDVTFVYMKGFSLSYIQEEVDNGVFVNEEDRYKQSEDMVWVGKGSNPKCSEYKEIDLKLCTNVFKTTSKASVLTYNQENYAAYKLLGEVQRYGTTAYMEEHLVDKYYNLLCDPKIQIESEVLNHDLIYPNDRIDNYQVIENSWDLDNDKQTIKLRQL